MLARLTQTTTLDACIPDDAMLVNYPPVVLIEPCQYLSTLSYIYIHAYRPGHALDRRLRFCRSDGRAVQACLACALRYVQACLAFAF
jgi:hypothetical protein